jgi:hypothetical protein
MLGPRLSRRIIAGQTDEQKACWHSPISSANKLARTWGRPGPFTRASRQMPTVRVGRATAAAFMKSMSIRRRGLGPCYVLGCDRIAASPKKNCRSISRSFSSCTNPKNVERLGRRRMWKQSSPRHPETRDEPIRISVRVFDTARTLSGHSVARQSDRVKVGTEVASSTPPPQEVESALERPIPPRAKHAAPAWRSPSRPRSTATRCGLHGSRQGRM